MRPALTRPPRSGRGSYCQQSKQTDELTSNKINLLSSWRANGERTCVFAGRQCSTSALDQLVVSAGQRSSTACTHRSTARTVVRTCHLSGARLSLDGFACAWGLTSSTRALSSGHQSTTTCMHGSYKSARAWGISTKKPNAVRTCQLSVRALGAFACGWARAG